MPVTSEQLGKLKKLNTSQRTLYECAARGSVVTNDPLVNWLVDLDHSNDSWNYDEQLERANIKVWLESGGFILKFEGTISKP